jgi:hypothetical protein
MKHLIQRIFGKVQAHAFLADIKGRKSGGARDSNNVDWKAIPSNDTN